MFGMIACACVLALIYYEDPNIVLDAFRNDPLEQIANNEFEMDELNSSTKK